MNGVRCGRKIRRSSWEVAAMDRRQRRCGRRNDPMRWLRVRGSRGRRVPQADNVYAICTTSRGGECRQHPLGIHMLTGAVRRIATPVRAAGKSAVWHVALRTADGAKLPMRI